MDRNGIRGEQLELHLNAGDDDNGGQHSWAPAVEAVAAVEAAEGNGRHGPGGVSHRLQPHCCSVRVGGGGSAPPGSDSHIDDPVLVLVQHRLRHHAPCGVDARGNVSSSRAWDRILILGWPAVVECTRHQRRPRAHPPRLG